MKKVFIIFLMALVLGGCDKKNEEKEVKIEEKVLIEKITVGSDLCSQLSSEFVTEATGIVIAQSKNINDASINACDYYLTGENNSPYIAIIVNKNLDFEKQKQIAEKMKFKLKTDEEIEMEHYVAWADNESRIVNINLAMDANNFIRVDKNVERAIDNEGLLKLARAVAKRL